MADTNEQPKGSFFTKNRNRIVLVLLLLLLVVGLLFILRLQQKQPVIPQPPEIIDTTTKVEPLPPPKDTTPLPIKTPVQGAKKSTKTAPKRDTVTAVLPPIAPDTGKQVVDPCTADTTKPWVYPDPSGGLHYSKAAIRFVASKPCKIQWKKSEQEQWQEYEATDSILITTDADICFQATDSCGNRMEIRCERYEIAAAPKQTGCPQDMEYIQVGQSRFCIDRYEWPNKKGRKPLSNISLYQSMDSCFIVGKRLCSSDEWTIACSGAHSWLYTYGDRYEVHACNTADTAVHPSGKQVECRGYFDVYDMSGNLAEWTSTQSRTNRDFYNVMGGFWDSGPQSTCNSPRYSYYPQNTHNPVGFRCCKDVPLKK
ncbi:MAG: SUMF1/EgtB/PvdO family nonheme iron enzyme [Chitinivibrionales bacterium]|nr:SUMF1/EgtB/PvdO family nonheme iron enzyme [Chitinivibrionales bacterium]